MCPSHRLFQVGGQSPPLLPKPTQGPAAPPTRWCGLTPQPPTPSWVEVLHRPALCPPSPWHSPTRTPLVPGDPAGPRGRPLTQALQGLGLEGLQRPFLRDHALSPAAGPPGKARRWSLAGPALPPLPSRRSASKPAGPRQLTCLEPVPVWGLARAAPTPSVCWGRARALPWTTHRPTSSFPAGSIQTGSCAGPHHTWCRCTCGQTPEDTGQLGHSLGQGSTGIHLPGRGRAGLWVMSSSCRWRQTGLGVC